MQSVTRNGKRLRGALAMAWFLVVCTSCATKQQTGAVVGAGAGAAAGSALSRGSTVGTLFGAVVGAAIGSEIGRQMDEEDRRQAAYALENTPTGHTHHWVNPDTGAEYEISPYRPYPGDIGPCRNFTVLAYVNGEPEEVEGTACRQPDGTWRMQ